MSFYQTVFPSVTVGVLWWLLLGGCQQATIREEPGRQHTTCAVDGPVAPTTNAITCDDGTCCGEKGIYYRYRERYTGDTVTMMNYVVKFTKPIPAGTTQQWFYADVCTLTNPAVSNLIYEVLGGNGQGTSIRCRLWGRLYTTDKSSTLTGEGPLRYIAIDCIEAIQ